MSKILIVAGTYQQARDWARQGELSPASWKYISNEQDLRGYHNVIVAFVGTYYQRKDIPQIRGFVKYLNRPVENVSIERDLTDIPITVVDRKKK